MMKEFTFEGDILTLTTVKARTRDEAWEKLHKMTPEQIKRRTEYLPIEFSYGCYDEEGNLID